MLKKYIDILLEDMQKRDALIENDLKEYANLLLTVENYDKQLAVQTQKKETFERMFLPFGKEEIQVESNHLKAINQTIEELGINIQRTEELIDKKQVYYEALKSGDYLLLCSLKAQEGPRASVYYVYKKYPDVLDGTVELLKLNSELSAEIAEYLMEKALILSEANDDVSEEGQKKQGLLDVRLQMLAEQTEHDDSIIWNCIEKCLKIRKTRRILLECEGVLFDYHKNMNDYEISKREWHETNQRIKEEVGRLKGEKQSRAVTDIINEIKQWAGEIPKREDALIMNYEKRSEAIIADTKRLETIKTELEQGVNEGLEDNDLDRIQDIIRELKDKKVDFIPIHKMEEQCRGILSEFKKHLDKLQSEKNVEAARQRAQIKRNAERKAEIKRFFGFKNICILATGILVVSIMIGLIWGYQKYYNFGGVLTSDLNYKSWGSSFSSITVPKKAVSAEVFYAECKKLTIYEGVKDVTVEGCKQLESLSIPAGVECVTLSNCIELKTLVLPEGIRTVNIIDCTELNRLDVLAGVENLHISGGEELAELTLPEGIKNITIERCNDLKEIEVLNGAEAVTISRLEELEKLRLTEGIKTLVIEECNKIETLSVPKTVETVTVDRNENMTGLIFPENIKNITITNCDKIEKLSIPNGAENISITSTDMLSELSLPEKVKTITIDNCHAMESLSVLAGTEEVTATNNSCLAELNLAEGVKTVYVNECDVMQKLVIPAGAQGVTVANCDELAELVLPEGIKDVHIDVESYCYSPQFNVPEGIENITLSNSYYENLDWLKAKNVTIRGCNAIEALNTPAGVETVNIESCEKLAEVNFAEEIKSITISDSDKIRMLNVPIGVESLHSNIYGLEKLNLPEGIKNIYVSSGCLETLNIPTGTEKLSLITCEKLKEINLPDGIKDVSVSDCSEISVLDIPANTEKVSINKCNELAEANLSEGIKNINVRWCGKLEELDISPGVESVKVTCCYALADMDLPEGVENVEIVDCPLLEDEK